LEGNVDFCGLEVEPETVIDLHADNKWFRLADLKWGL